MKTTLRLFAALMLALLWGCAQPAENKSGNQADPGIYAQPGSGDPKQSSGADAKQRAAVIPQITEDTKRHLRGEVKGNRATGGHIHEYVLNGHLRHRPGSPMREGPGDMYRCRIDINAGNGRWVGKDAESSFFPRTWNEQRVWEEISVAYQNKQPRGGNTFEGRTSNNITVRLILKNNASGDIITAYPIF